jgi:uncharacterized membrane protein YkoI
MPPGAGSSPRGQDLQSGGAMSSNGWSQGEAPSRAARRAAQADIDAAKSARVSLTQAINAAQGHSHGEVVAARFELRQGKPEYLVRAFDGRSRQEWLGHIDANTGQLIGRGRTMPLSRLPQADQQELTAVAESGTSLAQAVRTVEQQRGGKALSASLSARNGQVGCRTELLKSDGSMQLAMTGPQPGRARSYR